MHFLSGNEGIIILLNGPSCVGKSSIQKAVQKQSSLSFLQVGIDTFFDALLEEPDLSQFQKEKKFDQYTPNGEYIRGIEYTVDGDGFPIVPLTIGPAGDRVIHGMHRAIAAYAQMGNNLIVDYILYKPEWVEDLNQALEGKKIIRVGVHAPLEVLEQRERSRNTSPIGHSRSHYATVHTGMAYDLKIDTSLLTPEESAQRILSLIESEGVSQSSTHSQ